MGTTGTNTTASMDVVSVQGSSGTTPVPLATAAGQAADQTLVGAVTETAPATDTASSGLNGRLQRIAQRLTSLIALLPTSLGTKTAANSLGVVLASDDAQVAALLARAEPANGSALTKALTSNATTNTGIASPAETASAPAASQSTGVVDLGATSRAAEILVIPFGTDTADQTFTLRVTGWKPMGTGYMPVNLGEYTCTLGTRVGISGNDVADTDKYCDTIVTASGTQGVTHATFSPADNSIAHVRITNPGCRYVQVNFNRGSSAASCNAMVGGC